MTSPTEAYVYEAIRSPRGRVRRGGGTLAGVASHELLAQLMRDLAGRGLPTDRVDDVAIGVSTAYGEQAANVARVAVLAAGWPDTVSAGVVSRLCCSGLDALVAGAAQVRSEGASLVVAGGVESMSRVPMMSDRPVMAEDPAVADVTGFVTIGVSADLTAQRHGFTRAELDDYAVRSHHLSAAAPDWASLVPVRRDEQVVLAADEGARPDANAAELRELPSIFGDDPGWERVAARFPDLVRPPVGLHTAATAPQMCDAASCAVLGSRDAGSHWGRRPRGRVAGWAHAAVRSPGLDATIPASRTALARAGIDVADVHVAEVNESFSISPLLLMRELGLPEPVVNAHGGAVSVGHPLGASGGILLANALDRLERRGGGFGLLVIPAALGLATALVVEV